MILQAVPNGAWQRGKHAALPLTPAAIVWPLVARGLSQRLGLEVGLCLPDGTIAGHNAAIIAAGRQRNGTQR